MLYSALFLAAAAVVSAQNYSTSGPLSVDPTQIDSPTRQAWCRAQQNTCPVLCGGRAYPNECDPNTFNYTCTCTNGNQPNISDYQQTMPFFICQEWKANCVDNHPNDLAGITACQSVTCGAKNASSLNGGSSSTSSGAGSGSASATASGSGGGAAGGGASQTASATSGGSSESASSTASGSGGAASATSSSAAVAMSFAAEYSVGIFLTCLFGIFGFAL